MADAHTITSERKNTNPMNTKNGRFVRPAAIAMVSAFAVGALVTLPAAAHAEPDAPIYTVTTSADSVLPGDTFTVTVAAANINALYAYDLKLGFDDSVLAYVEDSAATEITGATYDKVSEDGVEVLHTKLGTSPAADGDVTLATAEFTALKSGDASVAASSLVSISSDNVMGVAMDLGAVDVTVAKNPAPVATVAPAISGDKRVGSTVKVSTGTWNVDGLGYSYRWLRNGKTVAGATSASYKVGRADADAKLSAVVSVTKDEYLPASATTKASAIADAATSTTVKASPTKVAKGKKVTLTIAVKASGITPVGHVSIKLGSTTVKSKATLVNGKVTVKFTPKTKSTNTLRVTYVPAKGFKASKATTKITVR